MLRMAIRGSASNTHFDQNWKSETFLTWFYWHYRCVHVISCLQFTIYVCMLFFPFGCMSDAQSTIWYYRDKPELIIFCYGTKRQARASQQNLVTCRSFMPTSFSKGKKTNQQKKREKNRAHVFARVRSLSESGKYVGITT